MKKNQNNFIPTAFTKLPTEELAAVNGGAITVLSVIGGIGTAYGIYEAAKLCVNGGIWIGNKLFKNNAKYI